MTNPLPILRGLKVYADHNLATPNIESADQVFIQEGTEITVAAIYDPSAPDTKRFIGTCFASEESKDERLPPSIESRCRFNIDSVRFDAPINLPIAADTTAQWGPSKIACTVTRISDL